MTPFPGIDLHTHVVPDWMPSYSGHHSESLWPSVHPSTCGHRHIHIGGSRYRTVSIAAWDIQQRLADMDGMRIGRQILSPMPELLSYWFNADDALDFARHMNGYIAEMVVQANGRMAGLGMVPLQDAALAARELERLRDAGLTGVEIGTNVNGKPIGDPAFEPFFAAAEALEMPIFVHAIRPAGMDRLVGPKGLEQVVAFPGETGLSIASMITGGTLERHPGLRLAFSHGGGSFGLMLPRLNHIWSISSGLSDKINRSPLELARKLFYDSLVYDEKALGYLIALFGPRQIILGTDYPFSIYDRDPLARLDRLDLTIGTRADILYANALRFLNMPAWL